MSDGRSRGPIPPNADDARVLGRARATASSGIQRCAACGDVPASAPPGVRALRRDRIASGSPPPGTGEVWSFTVIHPPTLPAFADRTPYGAVVVRLDEGVFLVSNLVDCPIDELAVGARVELAITESPTTDLALPLFRRRRARSAGS